MSELTTQPTSRVVRPVPEPVSQWTINDVLFRWNLAQNGAMLPLFTLVQALVAGAVIVGFGFLIPSIDVPTAQFLSAGAPTVMIMVIGLVLCPQGVAHARTSGQFTYLRSLPVPRLLLFISDLVVWALIAAPAIPVTVLVAHLRYGFDYSFAWLPLIGGWLLVTVMATSVGYALAVLLSPQLAQLISQVLVFFVMLFSPVTFPASQLPGWFQALHDVLPFRPAGDLIRAGLLSDTYPVDVQDVLVLSAWTAFGVIFSIRALVSRD